MPPVSASGINLRLWLKAYRDYFCQFTFSGLILTLFNHDKHVYMFEKEQKLPYFFRMLAEVCS